jgi:hypothetical protein
MFLGRKNFLFSGAKLNEVFRNIIKNQLIPVIIVLEHLPDKRDNH